MVVAALGPALNLVPLQALQIVIGVLLLLFGLGWLRKAVLRAAGLMALHDEDAIFEREKGRARERGAARPAPPTASPRWPRSRPCCSKGWRWCSSCWRWAPGAG